MKSPWTIKSLTKVDGIVRIGDIGYFSPSWRERTPREHLDNEMARKGFSIKRSAPLHPYGNVHTITEDIVGHYPLMGFDYVVAQDGLAADTSGAFNLERLMDIRQLSFLTCPVRSSNRTAVYNHKRYGHMLDTMAITNMIVENNRAELTRLAPVLGFKSGKAGFLSLRNTLLVAAVTHDIMTVAGGDGVKHIDSAALDEDSLYPKALSGKEWEFFRDTWSIQEDVLVETILGKGLLGRILDTADKSSYVARDPIEHLWLRYGYKPGQSNLPEGNPIADILREDPNVSALWESAKIVDGQLVFTDHRRLTRFLRLRAMLFGDIYTDIIALSGEKILGSCLTGALYRQRKITRSDLLRETDGWLVRRLSEHIGSPDVMRHYCHDQTPSRQFDTKTEAIQFQRLLDRQPDMLARVEKSKCRTSPGTQSFLTIRDGKIGTFAEMFPGDSVVIADSLVRSKPWRVYARSLSSLGVPSGRVKSLKEELSLVPVVLN